ncbi:MAG: ParA family protein [Bacteroidales bacterium]|nr:ParA family protein [Bacteroidales bacterium]
MPTISISMAKGGVAKTTTSLSLAANLADIKNYRVLLIDTDAQANLTKNCLRKLPAQSIFDCAAGRIYNPPVYSIRQNLDILPANHDLYGLSKIIYRSPRYTNGAELGIIRNVIKRINTDYDFIIIDCPPGGDILTVSALVAADAVLMPMAPELYALDDANWFLNDIILKGALSINPALNILGFVITMYDRWNSTHMKIKDIVASHFGQYDLGVQIRKCNYLKSAPLYFSDIYQTAPDSNAARDYDFLANRICDRLGMKRHK